MRVVENWMRALVRLWRERADAPMETGDIEQYEAWSISCQLAAVPPGVAERAPKELARLIRQAKSLHPQMARGAQSRHDAETQGDQSVSTDRQAGLN